MMKTVNRYHYQENNWEESETYSNIMYLRLAAMLKQTFLDA